MLIKCKEHKEIFIVENGKKCWIENWDTYVHMGFGPVEKEVDVLPFEKLRDEYPVGATKVKKTVTTIVEGKKPRDIFYPEESPFVHRMAILGTCLPNTPIEHMKQIGFTHFIGNREGWPSHADVKAAGLKLFVNIHPYDNSVPTNAWIKEKVLEHKDKAYCGGFWSDSVGGEEPDARPRSPEDAKKCLADRIRFKEQVRLYAPDAIRWPVVEQFNQTEEGVIGGLWRPGWKNMYDERTLDILLHDCYTFSESDQVMKDNIRKSYSAFPGKYCKNVQVIPQMNAYNYRPGSIWTAYNAWVECLGKPMAVAFYKDETVRKNAEMQAEIKEVIHEAMNV